MINNLDADGDLGVEQLLTLHQRRRDSGLPTVSVLTGTRADAEAAWLVWAIEAGHRPLVSPWDHPGQLVAALVYHVRANSDLPRLALNALLRRSGQSPTASTSPLAPPLDGRTPQDLDVLAAPALAIPDPAGAAAAVAHEVCRLALSARPPPADELTERLDARLSEGSGRPGWRVLGALDELLPARACPALLVVEPADGRNGPDALRSAAAALADLAEAVPKWPVGLAASPGGFDRYMRGAADSRAKSLLGTGVIRAGHGNSVAPRALEVAAAARAEAVAVAQPHAGARSAAADAARSAAERLFFQMLEAHPATCGQFVLNGCPGFDHGSRPAEVDLLAADLHLAVEVDGYFHFNDPDAYRRDRRKDWLLQQHGYTVVRVLADDVSVRAEKVLDFVVSAVEHCRRSLARSGRP